MSHHILLNDTLRAYYGYPVFVLNEGVAGITSGGYVSRMATPAWQSRMNRLRPNKWLIHLGINDGVGSELFQNNIQTLIDTLVNTYGASGSDIVLAVPAVYTNWQPYIKKLIADNRLTRGPDFNTYFARHDADVPDLYTVVHPTVTGHVQMARLWAISVISPRNVSAWQSSSTIKVSWDSLDSAESSIAGYKVYYGTDPRDLNNVVDVGDLTSTTISSGLTPGETYYFAVQGYDNDAYSPNLTATSSVVSVPYEEVVGL